MSLCFVPGTLETKSPVTEPGAHALLCVGTPSTSGVLIRGEPSPVPMCPSGRIQARPERARMRLPSPKGGSFHRRIDGKSGTLLRHDTKCRLPFPPDSRFENAAAWNWQIRDFSNHCSEH